MEYSAGRDVGGFVSQRFKLRQNLCFFHSYRLLGRSVALQGFWGAIGVDFGGIWDAVGSHFDDFCRIRFIFESVCFNIVKPYFLRFGRVLDCDFFVLCFWIYAFN